MTRRIGLFSVAAWLSCGGLAGAQWNPNAGQWGKSVATDLRIMTYNVHDDICSTNNKVEGTNDWCALARTIAALKPDVLIMQECGDNSGQGTGSTIDTVAQLTSAVSMFLHGGTDSFHENTAITSWVQKYAPVYDLPYVFVSSANDGFNRNVILSRYPFADLNGDGVSTYSDFTITADLYAPGGNGGIRGMAHAEIDLPDATYAGDMVMACLHLKSGGASGDLAQRLTAAQNIAYYMDYLYNGAGGSVPDPRNHVVMSPRPTSVLGPNSAYFLGGDLNESFAAEHRRGPAEWITRGPTDGGTDGCDKDRSDATFDDARDLFTNSPTTQQSSPSSTQYKDDYLLWQDSVAGVRRIFVFYTPSIPAGGMPPELTGFTGGGVGATTTAGDHRPVVADFIMPLAAPPVPGAFALLAPSNGATNVSLSPTLTWGSSANAVTYSVKVATDPGLTTVVDSASGLVSTSYSVSGGALSAGQTYYWGVTAVNGQGQTSSSPSSFSFGTIPPPQCPGDFTNDHARNTADLTVLLGQFGSSVTPGSAGDMNGDGVVNTNDLTAFLGLFGVACP